MSEQKPSPTAITDRAPYAPITARPAFKLPGDARIAVWTIVNVEAWSPARAMPRAVIPPPMGRMLMPDISNWAWHEYGMRVGFWRFLEVLASRNLKASFAVNGSAIEAYPDACAAAREAGWDFMGHGYEQRPMHDLDDQAEAIRKTVEAITAFTGRPPRGWESPGLTETEVTLDHLAAAGIGYVCDWCLDDQPVRLKSDAGSIVSVPYSVEVNDVVVHAVQGHSSDELMKRGIAQFDRLLKDGASTPRVMAIAIHPYLTGVPHRIGYLEQLYDHILGHEGVVHWTGAEILDWFIAEEKRLGL